jgi:copper chaperone CopZ
MKYTNAFNGMDEWIRKGGPMNKMRMGLVFVEVLSGCVDLAQAATERTVMLMLGGEYCDLYLGDVESALKKLTGVKTVDFKSMKGHVIVTVEGDKTTVNHLEKAVNGVKGDGWHCSAQVMK